MASFVFPLAQQISLNPDRRLVDEVDAVGWQEETVAGVRAAALGGDLVALVFEREGFLDLVVDLGALLFKPFFGEALFVVELGLQFFVVVRHFAYLVAVELGKVVVYGVGVTDECLVAKLDAAFGQSAVKSVQHGGELDRLAATFNPALAAVNDQPGRVEAALGGGDKVAEVAAAVVKGAGEAVA